MRVRVKGQENVDKTQTYVIMSNHQSMLDILFLYRVPLFFKWVSKHETYRIPFVGQLLWLHGDVTVKREDTQSIKRMMHKCTYWLQKKMCIMIFPEGTRSKTGQIGQFKRGAFVLAKRNALPILPVVLHGTRNFASGNRWNLLNARQLIQITILPPITAEEVCTTDAETMMEKTHNIMCAEHKKMLETEQTFSTRNG
jgi:1-acyl-sn-glycerol-3-phosphate acyltransferase